MGSIWIGTQVGAVVLLAAALVILLGNIRTLQRLGEGTPPGRPPFVSVLVPARNEEDNIGPCVQSLLAQDYPNYEVLVLDDGSEDGTLAALQPLLARRSRLRLLRGKLLPSGWLGKSWACHQLARAARGDLLLFTDADTRHAPDTVRAAVTSLVTQGADLLTAFPRQEVLSWSERLLVPILTWCFMVFLPLRLAYRTKRPELAIATGQFLLFRRGAYERCGGHAAIRGEPIDDLALCRNIKARGYRWRLADGSKHVTCRMYRDRREVFAGLTKNLFPGFQHNVTLFMLTLVVLFLLLVAPPATLLLALAGVTMRAASVWLAAAAVGMTLLLGALSYPRFAFPAHLIVFYPLTAIATIAVGCCSLARSLLGLNTWKGRRLARSRLRFW